MVVWRMGVSLEARIFGAVIELICDESSAAVGKEFSAGRNRSHIVQAGMIEEDP